ncbi:S-layer homology domain-containing protein [Ammoniphilus sp. YIM 78166]|uniref:S-layer homology domain-containing protein n=1 Tax=Ammoniphilus sp. YIM 78166 TaxID=1644106 RepID=UPI00106FC9FF|nr:S-layer homology domain-containing protein [Ammoniphilus sp. YIM 78166]
MKKHVGWIALTLALLVPAQPSVWAFSDLQESQVKQEIVSLKERGIVKGYSDEVFAPLESLTYAQAVQLIVKGFDLNLDHIRFIKQPLASDYYTAIPNDAWYSSAFVVAHHHGLDIDQAVRADEVITREQFADLLMKAVLKTGEYAFIEIFMLIGDEEKIDPSKMDTIQKLLITKMAALDDSGNFYPDKPITREDAAVWLYRGLEFIQKHS